MPILADPLFTPNQPLIPVSTILGKPSPMLSRPVAWRVFIDHLSTHYSRFTVLKEGLHVSLHGAENNLGMRPPVLRAP